MNYYVIRQYSKAGTRQTPANYPYTDRAEAERQYALLLAAAWKNEMDKEHETMDIDFESVEIGTVEQGKIKREYFDHVKPEPEAEAE
jgi:hypothetical protein